MSYAAASDVATNTPGLLKGGENFTAETRPTLKQVEKFLSAGCSLIHARLESAGYSVPVDSSVSIYDQLVTLEALYAAGRAEMVVMTARVSVTERSRSQMFSDMFNKGMDQIMKLDLSRLGVGQDSSLVYCGGISTSEKEAVEADTDRVVPRFTRGQFRHAGTTRPGAAGDDDLTNE